MPSIPKELAGIAPKILNLFYQRLSQAISCPDDLTLPQLKALQNLFYAGKPLKMSELSRMLGLSQSTLTDTVKKLAAARYVERRRKADDDRVVLIHLTPKSQKILRTHHRAVTDFFERVCRKLTPSDQRKLLTSYQFIYRAFSEFGKHEEQHKK